MADELDSFSLKAEVVKVVEGDNAASKRNRGRTWRRRKRTKNTQNRPHILLDPDYINLLKWAKRNGVVFDGIRPAIFHDTGRGMVATRNIKNNRDIVSVPEKLLITTQTALKSVIGTIYQRVITRRNVKMSKKCLLCLYLIYLRYLGKQSFWFPYIKTLPKDFNTPSYFKEKELKLLPSSCSKRCLNQISELKIAFENVQDIFGETLREFDINFNRKLTYDNFRWAWFVINTRSVYLESSKQQYPGYHGNSCDDSNYALAPVLDLLNHNDTAEIQAGLKDNTKAYSIATVTEYSKGKQVFINYGPHDNTTLLIEYGFILPKNIHNLFKFDPSQVYKLLSLPKTTALGKKLDIINRNDFEKDFSCSLDHGISWNLLTSLRILALQDNAIDDWTKVFHADSLSLNSKELVIRQWVSLIVSSTLETLIREDAVLETDAVISTNMSLALELRKQEIDILKNVLSQIENTES